MKQSEHTFAERAILVALRAHVAVIVVPVPGWALRDTGIVYLVVDRPCGAFRAIEESARFAL